MFFILTDVTAQRRPIVSYHRFIDSVNSGRIHGCCSAMTFAVLNTLNSTLRYDERTDIWSMGCILLEMATCGFMDVSMIIVIIS